MTNTLIKLIIKIEIITRNRFNFWFETFNQNDTIFMTRSNIDFKYIIENNENHIYFIYKFVYRLYNEINKQAKIAIDEFFVYKNNANRSWNLILSNLRIDYAFNNVFSSIIFVHKHVHLIRQIINESNFMILSLQILRSIKKIAYYCQHSIIAIENFCQCFSKRFRQFCRTIRFAAIKSRVQIITRDKTIC